MKVNKNLDETVEEVVENFTGCVHNVCVGYGLKMGTEGYKDGMQVGKMAIVQAYQRHKAIDSFPGEVCATYVASYIRGRVWDYVKYREYKHTLRNRGTNVFGERAYGQSGNKRTDDYIGSEEFAPHMDEDMVYDEIYKLAEDTLGAGSRDMDILRSRKLLKTGEKAVTLMVLGERHGVSYQRIQELEVAALAKLKEVLINEGYRDE